MRSFLSLEHPLPHPPPQPHHHTSSSPTPSPSHTPSRRLPHPLFPIGHPIYQRFTSQPKSNSKKDHPSQKEQAPSHSPKEATNPETSPKPPSSDPPSSTPAQSPLSTPSEELNTQPPLWNPHPGPRTRSQSLVLLRGVRDNSPAPDHSNGFQPPLSQLDGGLDELQEPPAPHQLQQQVAVVGRAVEMVEEAILLPLASAEPSNAPPEETSIPHPIYLVKQNSKGRHVGEGTEGAPSPPFLLCEFLATPPQKIMHPEDGPGTFHEIDIYGHYIYEFTNGCLCET